VIQNLDKILDAHTHLSGPESGESAESILDCMDACGVEKAFIFAPELDIQTRLLTNEHLDDIHTYNDYCADVGSKVPDRLLGFCNLNPARELAGLGQVHKDALAWIFFPTQLRRYMPRNSF